jgi:hypothetical protein
MMKRRTFGTMISGFVCVFFLMASSPVFAQCPAGSTCFGEIDSNSQSPSISFSGDIAGARWLTHLGDFELTFSSDNSATQTLGTGDVTFLGNTYRPKVAFTPTGDVQASGSVSASGNVSANAALISNGQSPAIEFLGDVDGAKWLGHLGGFDLTFSSDNSDTTTLGTGDTVLNGRTYRPKVAVNSNGSLSVSGGIVFPDGSVQTKAQAVGPQGPAGPQGAQGPQGPAGPGSTSAVCFSVASPSANTCGCSIRLVSQTLLNANSNGTCTATANTGSCSANANSNGPISATCCVCAPN